MKRIIVMSLLLLATATSVKAEVPWVGALWNDRLQNFVPNIAGLDWSSTGSGNIAGIPGGSIRNAAVGTRFSLRLQSYMAAPNSATLKPLDFPGLNEEFEYTSIASFDCVVTNITLLANGSTRYMFDVLPGGQVYMLHSAVNAAVPTGAGFDDGDVVVHLTNDTLSRNYFYYMPDGSINGNLQILASVIAVSPDYIVPAASMTKFTLQGGFFLPLVTDTSAAYFSSGAVLPSYQTQPGDISVNVDTLSLMGTACSGSMGDFVWNDQDGNGVQDSGEPGIDGVEIILRDSMGVAFATRTTATAMNQHGFYQFNGLCPGTYSVEFNPATVPAEFTQTRSFETTYTSLDSNASPSAVILTPENLSDQTVDFGFVPPSTCLGSIGDFIWYDANRNGLQDAGEQGIDNVKVSLYDNVSGLKLSTVTTAPASGTQHGFYQFNNLCAGEYRIEVDASTLPAGYIPTLANQGSDRATDSNALPAVVLLPSNTSIDHSVDFGYISPCTGTIGDFVWHDLNRNGLQDSGEAGLDGITVKLYGPGGVNGAPLASVTTGAHGIYHFTGLCAGSYTVSVDETTLPAGFSPTAAAGGSDSALDSNGSPAAVTLPADDSSNLTIDFGYLSPCTGVIGDRIWEDVDGNGIQDSGEAGMADIILNMRDISTNSLLMTTATDGNGIYRFTGVCAGEYKIEAVRPSGYLPSIPGAPGSTVSNDSNPNPSGVTLPSDSASDLTIDFGFYKPASLGDFVWHDMNVDGIQDSGEQGIAGVTVQLFTCGGSSALAGVTTDANGYYTFSDLAPGSYYVRFTAPSGFRFTLQDQGSYRTLDSNADASGVSGCITLTSGAANKTIDAGLYQTSHNCTYTQGYWKNHQEKWPVGGLALGTKYYYKSQLLSIFSQQVKGNGLLALAHQLIAAKLNLANGASAPNVVRIAIAQAESIIGCLVVPPIGYGTLSTSSTSTLVGILDAYNNGRSGGGPAHCADEQLPVCTGTIGDFIWNDVNGNGIQDAGEPGIAGVSLKLNSGAATTSGANGFYSFTGLCAGSYQITAGTPAGFTPAPSNKGCSRSNDSNSTPASSVLATDNSIDTTVDFGFVEQAVSEAGCTPGYWKNHSGNWPAVSSPVNNFDAVFSVNAFQPDKTLLQALALGGGGLAKLARHATAALLNAEDERVSYPLSAADIISAVRTAVSTRTYEPLATKLDKYNNLGCPLN